MSITIVTFNIRVDVIGDGVQYFFNRSPYILKKINEESPDIICFQEVSDRILEWLKSVLTNYNYCGVGRENNYSGESNPVFYKKDCFKLLRYNQFWLSDTPEIPGSRYDDQSSCPRICVSADLFYINENKCLNICNTHLDHVGYNARKEGILLICNSLKTTVNPLSYPSIITGDFNSTYDENLIDIFNKFGYTDVSNNIKVTYHGYKGKKATSGKIDYILTNFNYKNDCYIWDDEYNGIYLSDHYPVCFNFVTK